MSTYKFTLREFIENIRKNGLPQVTRLTFTRRTNVSAGGACALGQGYWNTIGNPENVDYNLEGDFYAQFNTQMPSVTMFITHLNDWEHLGLDEIATRASIRFSESLDEEIVIVQ